MWIKWSGWLAGVQPPPFADVLWLGLAIIGGWALGCLSVGWRRFAPGRTSVSGEVLGSKALPEADLAKAQLDRQLAEVNQMAGGLAHEIRNPLSTIGLNVQLLREDLDAIAARLRGTGSGVDAPQKSVVEAQALALVQRRLEGVHRETARLRGILEDFLRFAGRIRLDLREVALDVTVEELIDFFTPEAASRNVLLHLEPGAGPGLIRADPALLKQALLNLLVNAMQAMTAGDASARSPEAAGRRGELLVRTRARTPAHGWSQIEVLDTGPGIPAEQSEKVFEPYHTTRGSGSGLGLPTSRRIVELHGGTLTLVKREGPGCCFRMTLPERGP